MKRLSYLENKQNDNDVMYSNINEYLTTLENYLEFINNELNNFPNISDYDSNDYENQKIYFYENLYEYFDNIYNVADEICDCSQTAKNYGVHNEEQLEKGNKKIDDMQEELDELQQNFYEIENEHDSLKKLISELEEQLDILEDSMNNMTVESSINRLKKISKSYSFICNAHDDMIDSSEKIMDLVDELKSSNKEYDDYKSFMHMVEDNIATIYSAMNEAINMNERMGIGVDNKIDKLYSLEDEINSFNEYIADAVITKDELENRLNDLQNILEELNL